MQDVILNGIKNKKIFNELISILEEKPIAIFETREVVKNRKIFFIIYKDKFGMYFDIDGQYELIFKNNDEVRSVSIFPTNNIGYQAKVLIKFKDAKNATCLINDKTFAAQMLTYILSKEFNEENVLEHAIIKNMLDTPDENIINIYGDFKAQAKKKILTITMLVVSMVAFIIIISAIAILQS